jgi:predicted aspartyl protease
MPTAEIRIGRPAETLASPPLMAILDTGADGTIVPRRHLDPLDLPVWGRATLRGQWDESVRAYVYLVDLGIGELRLPGIEVAADDRGDDIIVGRDVLNRLLLSLDGPRKVVDIRA